MAIVFVGSKTFAHNATSDQSCSLTDLLDSAGASVSPAAGDIVFVNYVHSMATTANRTLAQCTPSGYSNTHGSVIQSNDTNAISMALSYKQMTASPDTTVSIPLANATTNNVSCTIECWRGVDPATITTTTPTTASASNTALANPPSITTPAAPPGCVVLGAFGGAQAVATAFGNAGATPYDSTTNLFKSGTANGGATNKAASGMGAKTGLAINTAFDAAVSGSTTTNTGSWGAASIVIRPRSTISLNVGSYAISGVATGLTAQRKLSALVGSYAISGTAATLFKGYKMAAAAGSYAISGLAAVFKRGLRMPAAVGSYVVSGTATAFQRGLRFACDAGSYAVNGTSAGLLRGLRFAMDAGSYALSGVSVAFTIGSGLTNYVMSAFAGAFFIDGRPVTFTRGTVAASAKRTRRRRRNKFRDYPDTWGVWR